MLLIPRLPVDEEHHRYHDWEIVYQKSHILHSMCTNERRCVAGQPDCCELCLYVSIYASSAKRATDNQALFIPAQSYEGTLDLPHLPEMVFPKNRLRLRHHRTGAQLEFNALDALRAVSKESDAVQKVSCAEEWQESRPQASACENGAGGGSKSDASGGGGSTKVRPYDWTFSTDYQGTLGGCSRLETTEAQLNIAKLKRQEHIEFYHDLTLFEDELHDHGIASSSVKIVSRDDILSGKFGCVLTSLHSKFLCVHSASCRPVSSCCCATSCASTT